MSESQQLLREQTLPMIELYMPNGRDKLVYAEEKKELTRTTETDDTDQQTLCPR